MKTVREYCREHNYQAPLLEVTELVTEGILCASGFDSTDSIPDLEEDYLNW